MSTGPGNASRIVYGLQTHHGPRRLPGKCRECDAHYANVGVQTTLDTDKKTVFGLFVVADGVGGYSEDESASEAAVDVLVQEFFDGLNDKSDSEISDLLRRGVQTANSVLFRDLPGTTSAFSAVVVWGNVAYLAHVGDTRVYKVDDEGIEQLTRDHSLVQRLIELDQITSEQAKKNVYRDALYRALGQTDSVQVDTIERPLLPNTTLLLCSDGLSDVLDEALILETIRKRWRPQRVSEELVRLALQKGSIDNITAVVVRVIFQG